MRKCLKRSVVLLLLLTLCLTAINAINTTPAEAAANEIMVFPYPRPADNNRENWGKEDMSFMGGWSLRATDYFSVFSNDYSGKIYYCIEPGHYIKTGDSYVEKGEAYWDDFPNNSTIDSRRIKEHIGRIFQYGYIGKINLNWTSQNDADTLGNVIATQILIWEVVVGERDSEFNHVAPGASYDAVLDIVSKNHPVYSQIMKNYNRIVNSMQAHLGSPSFMAEDPNIAQTVELKWNGTEYTATLTDTNNVLSNYRFEPSNSNVKVTVSGNKLILASKVAVNNVTISAIRTLKRSGLIVWNSATRQDIATYSAEVSDPLQAFIKLQTQEFGSINVIKTSSDGKVSGIEFTLTGGDLTTPLKGKTDSKGSLTFSGLKAGTYTITETVPPKYESQKPQTITVRAGQTATVIFANKLKTHDLEIIKVNEKDEAVSGVVFIIEKSLDGKSWTELMQKETDENGKASFVGLLPDVYYKVTEIKTKYGYSLLSEPVFEGQISTADKPVITIKAINNPEFELPPTGGNSFLYIPIVLGLSMGAIVTIYYLIKKERGKKI